MMKTFPESELILNADGSVFHLHLLPSQLADHVILVGDPDRVSTVASFFDTRECEVQNREFHTITGSYKGKRITVLSTGIGTDNIDIVMNELDALANIDLQRREERPTLRPLTIVRIGTCGSMQPEIELGAYLASELSIGFDGVLNFYKGRDEVSDLAFEDAFKKHVSWSALKASPYVVAADKELLERITRTDMIRGVTISANGFYGPQGRVLRLDLDDMHINDKIESFRYGRYKITNYEMEGSAIAGMSLLMGHKALTVCCVIANRYAKSVNVDYKMRINRLIQLVLDRI
ncbi:MAG: nucleoside phosphorylase [Paludibacteraceae bacterium]|nr:nucleoside phosphorylase [Paludibacteraceae bacterium]